MPMKNPPHPGDFIRTEIVEPAGLSVTAAAVALQVSRPALSSLLNSKADLSGEMALRIEKAFGVKMETLMDQSAFDIARTRSREKEIRVRRFHPRSDARYKPVAVSSRDMQRWGPVHGYRARRRAGQHRTRDDRRCPRFQQSLSRVYSRSCAKVDAGLNPPLQQFVSVALPIMLTLVVTIWLASWSQNKRFDDINKRFDDINKRFDDFNTRIDDINRRIDDLRTQLSRRLDEIVSRLDRIERKLDNHEERIVRLEERTSLIH